MAEEEQAKPTLPTSGTSLIAAPAGQDGSAQEMNTDAQDGEEQTEEQQRNQQREEQELIDSLDMPPIQLAAEPTSAAPTTPISIPSIAISRPSTSSRGDADHSEQGDAVEQQTADVEPPIVEDAAPAPTEQPGPSPVPENETSDNAEPTPVPVPSKDDDAASSRSRPLSEVSAAPTSAGTTTAAESSTAASRRSSVTSTATSGTMHSKSSLHSLNKGSAVFVISALETIAAHKEAKGSKDSAKALRDSTTRALEMVKAATQGGAGAELDPRVVFEPLRLACKAKSTTLLITSLDCIGKLVSYSFFAEDTPSAANPGEEALADVVTNTICDAFHDKLDDRAQLQIIKALISVVLSTSVHVHQSSLLKAVRTVYNIFIMSSSPPTQAVAQGVLTQMVHHVFGRVPRGAAGKKGEQGDAKFGLLSPPRTRRAPAAPLPSASAEPNGSSEAPAAGSELAPATQDDDDARSEVNLDDSVSNAGEAAAPADGEGAAPAEAQNGSAETAPAPPVEEERVTLKTLETRASFEGASEKDTAKALLQANVDQDELFVKDAFLVFRALCKLSMKPLTSESDRDLKSPSMRSTLLSLHLILTILRSHMVLFTDASIVIHSASTGETTPFAQAVKQYLCLSLSRNAVSPVNQVFEISCEIFWLVLSGMRTKLKKEIEVLLNEIFLPILEMRNATAKQKSILLGVLIRLCQDPQALVEIYLNYDCDRAALDNIYERLMNVISKISQAQVAAETLAERSNSAKTKPAPKRGAGTASNGPLPATLNTSDGAASSADGESEGSVELRLKRQSLDCLCAVLRSLVVWSSKSSLSSAAGEPSNSAEGTRASSPRPSEDRRRTFDGGDDVSLAGTSYASNGPATPVMASTPDATRTATPDADDPGRFESAKQRKTTLIEGIKKFNFKPKRGVQFLIEQGFIRSREPREIARFLLYADGLNKAQIGEYLGEGEPENIAIMHSFVDLMNFERMAFTDALRRFLQAFRLPGEAQKIDRYMLKFAERYVAGNPSAFANADTAYVFAYSVIMLNTDAHNPQIKNRMSLVDFVKNNRGIDDGKDLPEEYIKSVYEEIQTNEIKMKDEVLAAPAQAAASTAGGGLANAIAAVGRDLQKEAYVLQSEGMANKTEALFRTMVRAQRRVHPDQRAAAEFFFSASHYEHVRPMFEVAWMAFLAGISGPLQESDDADVIAQCLDAFRDAIRIVCIFGLELERNAFVTTLAKFTFLNNLGEMRPKNVEAIKCLLGVAQTEGNYLKGSWRELLTCVSQLERFQLISGGMDERQLPELGRRAKAASVDAKGRPLAAPSASRQALPTEDVVQAGASSEVTVAADMVFSSTPHLSGTAIVDFVQSLSDVSWEEIQSSGMTESPRLFSLQKLVEISYYNMGRIRMEWSNIWAILGEHFNHVCIHPNPRVSAFGLDSLRQLSNRFLEKEELPHFKFQKDFLKPFEYTMRNNASSEAKEMVLQCLQQMIASRIQNMRSGWRTLFGVFGAASRASERVATYAFELVRQLNQDHFTETLKAGAFADLTVCLTDFAKASHAQRLALQAVSMLRSIVPAMLASSECPIDVEADPGPAVAVPMSDDPMVRFWFPALFAFYDVIMNGDDLEVRRVALDSLFEILKKYGSTFRPDFWDTVCQEVLFPIFAVLRSRSDVSRFSTQEDMSVWLSTTLIQALRNLIDLWTFYFTTLERLLPGLLDLLCACICQENDTLARIGTSCLQQLLEQNVRKLGPARWTQVVDTFVHLFRTTTAHQLFEPALRSEQVLTSPPSTSRQLENPNSGAPVPLSPDGRFPDEPAKPLMTHTERRRAFKQIIVKCVLQLLLIETTHELLSEGQVYDLIPPSELLRLTVVLEDSYRFSKRFNADKELRMALWKVGFMKQLPNLLKQESSSAATLIHVLVRMHGDSRESHRALQASVRERLVPLSENIVTSFLPLDPETQARNITAWTGCVAEVFHGLCTFDDSPASGEDDVFSSYTPTFYPLAVDLLAREPLPVEIARAIRKYFFKVGVSHGFLSLESEERRKRGLLEAREREKVTAREANEAPRPAQPIIPPSASSPSLNSPEPSFEAAAPVKALGVNGGDAEAEQLVDASASTAHEVVAEGEAGEATLVLSPPAPAPQTLVPVDGAEQEAA